MYIISFVSKYSFIYNKNYYKPITIPPVQRLQLIERLFLDGFADLYLRILLFIEVLSLECLLQFFFLCCTFVNFKYLDIKCALPLVFQGRKENVNNRSLIKISLWICLVPLPLTEFSFQSFSNQEIVRLCCTSQ